MSNPVGQHTVPCSYLQGFGEIPNGRETILFRLNIEDGKTLKGSASSMTIINDFYTIKGENGEKDYVIEDFFAQYIESGFKDIVEKIENQEDLSSSEIQYLAQFITFQEMRSKSRRDWDAEQDGDFLSMMIRDIVIHCDLKSDKLEGIKNSLKTYFSIIATDKEAEEILHKFENGEKIVLKSNEHSVKMMMILAPKMAQVIQLRQWIFLHAPQKHSFIVSDYPIYLHAGDACLFGSPGYMTADFIGFPISKKVYLMLGDTVGTHQIPIHNPNIDPEHIIDFNYCTCYGTDRWIIGNNQTLLEEIHKTINKIDSEYKKKHKS